MKPFAFLAFAAVGLAACQEPSSPSAPGDKPAAPEVSAKAQKGELIPGQYVVVFRQDVRDVKSAAKALAGKHGAKLKHTYEAALKGMAIELPDSAAAALRQDPAVEFVEQNQVVRRRPIPSFSPVPRKGWTGSISDSSPSAAPIATPLTVPASVCTSSIPVSISAISTSVGRAVLGTDVSGYTDA